MHQLPVRETVIALKFDTVVFLIQVPRAVANYVWQTNNSHNTLERKAA